MQKLPRRLHTHFPLSVRELLPSRVYPGRVCAPEFQYCQAPSLALWKKAEQEEELLRMLDLPWYREQRSRLARRFAIVEGAGNEGRLTETVT